MRPSGLRNTARPALTEWLDTLIQDCAGLARDGAPLTVKDLWRAPMPKGAQPPRNGRNIDLVLMTTNVTRGITGRFPNLEDWRHQAIFFNPTELRFFFPERIVDFMISNGRKRAHRVDWPLPEGYFRLPDEADLPVLFGARLSMSFPLLLSAVPLYQIDWVASRKHNQTRLQRCWFSDGGLTSNFPIHFFDTPVPVRPTFAIDLVSAQVDTLEEEPSELRRSDRATAAAGPSEGRTAAPAAGGNPEPPYKWVWMPRDNRPGLPGRFRSIEQTGLSDFLWAMFDAARHWKDTEQILMPGYRDRIAEIHLKSEEGGLNLGMGPEVIDRIAQRGREAGTLLAARFSPRRDGKPNVDPKYGEDITLDWDNHRWVRFRSLMAAHEEMSDRFATGWDRRREGAPAEETVEKLLKRKLTRAPSYPWATVGHQQEARLRTTTYLSLAKDWQAGGAIFDRFKLGSARGQAPRPKVELRVKPPE